MKRVEAYETTLRGYLLIDSDIIGELMIPFSQRPYEWEKAQVERLFNDLMDLYFTESDIHMLNFFTLSSEDGEVKIFDGQQRTITSLLILSILFKRLKQAGNFRAADQFYEMFIEKIDHTASDNHRRKLHFKNTNVEDFFYKLVNIDSLDQYIVTDYDEPTILNLIRNYQLIDEKVERFIEKHELESDQIRDLINRILNFANLITIKTATDELAMAMFESLNNTGKQLDNFYVLKNDLVLMLGEQHVIEPWKAIEVNLAEYNHADFLSGFATVLKGKTSKKASLNEIYRYYPKNDATKMNELLELLVESSKYYLYLRNPAQLTEVTDQASYQAFRRYIDQINLFITKQHHPLLLGMFMGKRDLAEINAVLKVLLNLGIRNLYFHEKSANSIENLMADLAVKVYQENMSTDEVVQRILKVSLKNKELKEAIRLKEVKTAQAEKRLKFILRETYNLLDLNREVEIRQDLVDIHYEHILPKSPNKKSQWLQDFKTDEERETYTRKVGNATLLLDKINQSASNQDFALKKGRYQESHIPANKAIAAQVKWTQREIDQRTNELANQIIKYLDDLIIS